MSAHNKGPWHVSKDQPIVFDNSGHLIAEVDCDWNNRSYVQLYANARLIAAAPDLLEALTGLVDYINGRGSATGEECLNRAERIIRKVTGDIDGLGLPE